MLTKNAERAIGRTLSALLRFPEVILLDNGSTDKTCDTAKRYPNVKIYTSPFIGFGPLRNLAASFASNDWIFALDSDEVPSPSLIDEIFALTLDEMSVYSVARHNFYNGKWIRGCGWHPDRVDRIYHRKKACFKEVQVHESLEMKGLTRKKLLFPLEHTPYLTTSDFLKKMEHYSTLFADEHKHKKGSSYSKALFHSAFTFFKSYILKRGIFLGKEGFIISLYNANTAFYKYLKLLESNQK